MESGRLSFVHLSGARRGQTDDFALPARIGSRSDMNVVVPDTAGYHALVFARDGEVVVKDEGSGLGLAVDGEAVEEAVLRDGDVLELGADGPKLRYRTTGADRAPLVRSMLWARPEGPVRASDTSRFLKALVRETNLRTSLAFRVIVASMLAIGLGVGAFAAWQSHKLQAELRRLRESIQLSEREQRAFRDRVEEERRRFDEERHARTAEALEFERREEELNRRLAEARTGEVEAVRADLRATRERLASLETEKAAAERIIREYGPGVCLIQGSFVFVDELGRSLRYVLDDGGQPKRDEAGQFVLDALGTGEVRSFEYVGTGFLVDRRGLVLTNRHVAEPWWKDAPVEAALAKGAKPRAVSFRAFFPREPLAFDLTLERVAPTVDLALVRLALRGRKIPVLPLDRSGRPAVAGSPVVVLGFPAGLEAILAKAEASKVNDIVDASGMNPLRMADGLAAERLIRPSATQGHIGDVTKTDIVFDAQTTHGGSGGPVLNRSGQVVGYALELLSAKPKGGG
jgi:serine protease Do